VSLELVADRARIATVAAFGRAGRGGCHDAFGGIAQRRIWLRRWVTSTASCSPRTGTSPP
jgi:hypothetical protein